MAKTPDTVALQKGAVTYTQPEQTNTKKAVDLMSTLLSTPTAPTGTTITPQVQQVASNELMGTSGLTGALAAAAPTSTAGALPTAQTGAQMTEAQVGVQYLQLQHRQEL